MEDMFPSSTEDEEIMDKESRKLAEKLKKKELMLERKRERLETWTVYFQEMHNKNGVPNEDCIIMLDGLKKRQQIIVLKQIHLKC